jgi:hypothetical protein
VVISLGLAFRRSVDDRPVLPAEAWDAMRGELLSTGVPKPKKKLRR